MRQVCVFCGSSKGINPIYSEASKELGVAIARRGIGLVYGGGHVGLMGIVADAVLKSGGSVIGVIPQALDDLEVAHRGLTELYIVDTMHTRKAMMADRADGFIAMPGGFGTLDEFCEIITWAQLGQHSKPCAILNINGYFDLLIQMFDHCVDEGFVKSIHRELVIVDDNVESLLDKMESWRTPPDAEIAKWIDREER